MGSNKLIELLESLKALTDNRWLNLAVRWLVQRGCWECDCGGRDRRNGGRRWGRKAGGLKKGKEGVLSKY